MERTATSVVIILSRTVYNTPKSPVSNARLYSLPSFPPLHCMLSRLRTVAFSLTRKRDFSTNRHTFKLSRAFTNTYNTSRKASLNGSIHPMEVPDHKTKDEALNMREESPLSDPPDEDPEPISTVTVGKPKRQRKKIGVTNQADNVLDVEKKTKRSRKKKVGSANAQTNGLENTEKNDASSNIKEEKQGQPKRVRKRKTTAEMDGDDFGETEKKKRRRKTPEEEKQYDIPPIENTLSTTFKGRLGYACLNSLLRKYSTPIFCSRTCRLATLGELGHAHARQLAQQNLADLHTLVKWNAKHNIFFMRMSSEMFPFASHPEVGYTLEFADAQLKEIGSTAKELGVRLTSHPGQFTQLGSPSEKVVSNAFRDLNCKWVSLSVHKSLAYLSL